MLERQSEYDPIEEFQHNGKTIKIYQDTEPENPREWDNLGTMVCWHPDYTLGDEQIDIPHGYKDIAISLNELGLDDLPRVYLPLYLYDHSGITMQTSPFSDDWDSGQVGFIYATAEQIRKWCRVQRIIKRLEERVKSILIQEVNVYNQYLTGDVWGYVIRDGDTKHLDSCSGFYGLDYAREEAKRVADVG